MNLRGFALGLAMASEFLSCIAGGTGLGYLLWREQIVGAWAMVFGGILGITMGVYLLWKRSEKQ